MIDLRYHIYSIAAVFFALAVGIVIGSSFGKGGIYTENERKAIKRYERNMIALKNQINEASKKAAQTEERAKHYDDFGRIVLPILLKDKLEWRNVAIIRTGDNEELSGVVKKTLELAGAAVPSVTEFNLDYDYKNEKKINKILKDNKLPTSEDGQISLETIFRILAENISTTKHANSLKYLEQAEIAVFNGDYNRASGRVVLIGGLKYDNEELPNLIDTKLIKQLQNAGIAVVGVESSNAKSSYISAWKKMGIATIDNIDMPMGQIALVYALLGEKDNFGIKETADRFMPQIMEKN